jgi:site-specific recombinase XerD
MKKDLQELFTEYISECVHSKRLRPETIKGYKITFDHFSTMMPEVTIPELLTREMLNEFFKRISTRERIVGKNTKKIGLEDSTIKTYGTKLGTFFTWLIQQKIITENPLEYIKLRHPEYKDKRALEDEEVRKVFAAITLHSKDSLMLKRDTAMVSVLFFCGLRLGEFISLQVMDVNMEEQKLTVRSETSKSKRTRYVPIHPTALLHLREYIKERNTNGYTTADLFVSYNEDKGLSRYGLKHWVQRLIKLSGVKFHLHRFRHSFATNLARNDVQTVKISKLMGHTDIRMTMAYLRSVDAGDLQEDINKLSI